MDDFEIPAPLARILECLRSDPEAEYREPWEVAHTHASLLGDLSWAIVYAAFPEHDRPPLTRLVGELDYDNVPFELVPVSWAGGDGLHYDWIVHAPELGVIDPPMVSWAPMEDGPVWLGDDTAQGLAGLLVGRSRAAAKRRRPDPRTTAQWRSLVGLIGLEPDLADTRITAGARTRIPFRPRVPSGHRFEITPDGVGVLAREDLFEEPGAWSTQDSESLTREALRLLDRGKAASALVALKHVRAERPADLEVIARMRDAYVALGRPMHARRAELAIALRRSR